ncbi:MAG: Txe/YoeB family addiction module toxin [Epsilonproteobacteria bacterium]|nr:MAG: Txe/YoeB family addiction module toxin [Campylobacterota bacterium]
MYQLIFSPQAKKDSKKVASSGLKLKVQELLKIIEREPLEYPPKFEYLSANLKGKISRRINKQHRLVYEIFEEEKLIKIYRMWTHYE